MPHWNYVEPRPHWKRTGALLCLLAVVVAGALLYTSRAESQSEEPLFACLPDAALVTDATVKIRPADGWRSVESAVTAEAIESLWALEGDSIWIGYENGGWDYPANIAEIQFAMYRVYGDYDGAPFYVLLLVSDGYSIGFVFDNTERFADANGDHYGQHPCGGWEIDGQAVEDAFAPPVDVARK